MSSTGTPPPTGQAVYGGRSLAEWAPLVVDRLFERSAAERIILFGSVARGDVDRDSDIDPPKSHDLPRLARMTPAIVDRLEEGDLADLSRWSIEGRYRPIWPRRAGPMPARRWNSRPRWWSSRLGYSVQIPAVQKPNDAADPLDTRIRDSRWAVASSTVEVR